MRMLLAVAVLLCVCSQLQADTILFEDFEDATITYSTNVPDALQEVAFRDYYGRIDPTTASSIPADVFYTNRLGSGFYGAQDIDSALPSPANPVLLNWTGIDISSYSGLSLSWYVAEDDATDGNEDWDITTSVRLEAQIDGGGFFSIFAIESSDSVTGNMDARVDTNFDGLGDGAIITEAFTQFSSSLANGSVLDIRLTIEDLDTGDEDIAFDNLLLSGTAAVPEPSSMACLTLIGVLAVSRRRRK